MKFPTLTTLLLSALLGGLPATNGKIITETNDDGTIHKVISIPETSRLMRARTGAKGCNADNCYRALIGRLPIASTFCPSFTASPHTATTGLGPFQTFCANSPARVSSACSCLVSPAPTTTSTTTSSSSSTTSSSTSSTTSAAPTCGPPGAFCTIDTFIEDCCHAPDGSVGCYFPTGDPYNGICFN